jgi:hydrazine synthase alpha subunit-like protein
MDFQAKQGLLVVTKHYENKMYFRVSGLGCFLPVLGRMSALLPVALVAGCLQGGDSQSSDPVVVENPVVFVKRPLLFDEDNGALIGDNLADPTEFRPGARLFLKDRASPDAPSRDITSSAFPGPFGYDVKDLTVSYDGSRVLFAMRAPEIEDEQPTWNIWEYDAVAGSLRRVIESDVTAEAGQDIAPAYLPDDRIVFSSTRQRVSRAILLDEGKPQYPALDEEREVPAFVLHVMDADGDNIEQITFNQSHDLDPLVTDEGAIVFSRWDNAGQTQGNGFNLYKVNPDGTGLSYLYGRHSHGSVSDDVNIEYLRPQATDSGRLLAQLRPTETNNFGAVPVEIDVESYVEASIRVDGNPGSAQTPLVSGLSLGNEISLRGNYSSVSPFLDGTRRYLVSWSPCRLRLATGNGDILNCTQERIASGAYRAAAPVYGLWLLDMASGTQRPIQSPEEGQQFDEAVLMTERSLPTFIPESQFSGDAATLAEDGLGILQIQSVYDIDGVDTSPAGIRQTADPAIVSPDNLPRRFLRLEKPVSIPDEEVRDFDNTAFGRSQAQSMREILGYVPVEPDGSVRVAVPANVAFAISVLDDEGRRIGPRHQNWLNVRPGETLACSGCHNPGSAVPHGRPDAGPAPAYTGALTDIEFPNADPALVAMMGETMAETWARINGIRRLGPNAVYVDQWTDPGDASLTPGTAFSLSYADLETPAPIRPECADDWRAACRTVINYEQHIHPLWGLERIVDDGNGNDLDFTCTGCHSDTAADESTRLPDAQLDLSDGPSTDEPDHFKSYRELLFTDNEQELVGDQLNDVERDTGEVLRDENGEPILDQDGNERPIFAPVPVFPAMSVNGARASGNFFDLFLAGGTHYERLSPDELRLIAEWLDIGGQYYNNPFDAPAD